MENNPFRQNPRIPPKHKTHPFGGNKKKDNSNIAFSRKEKEWGMKKFIPVVRTQAATPWATFKNEIIQKEQEERNATKSFNMESEEAKAFLKKREEDFRRMQIVEAKKQDTKWEDFGDDLNVDGGIHDSENNTNLYNKRKKKDKKLKKAGNSKNSIPIVEKGLLKNFDPKKLSFEQNNTIRKAITKTTHLARGATLESVVNDMKTRGIKRKKS